jgi:hypothetical protein
MCPIAGATPINREMNAFNASCLYHALTYSSKPDFSQLMSMLAQPLSVPWHHFVAAIDLAQTSTIQQYSLLREQRNVTGSATDELAVAAAAAEEEEEESALVFALAMPSRRQVQARYRKGVWETLEPDQGDRRTI